MLHYFDQTQALTGAALREAVAVGSSVAAALLFVRFLLIFLAVVLPAVWSRKDARRKAALHVLREIWHLVKRPRAP